MFLGYWFKFSTNARSGLSFGSRVLLSCFAAALLIAKFSGFRSCNHRLRMESQPNDPGKRKSDSAAASPYGDNFPAHLRMVFKPVGVFKLEHTQIKRINFIYSKLASGISVLPEICGIVPIGASKELIASDGVPWVLSHKASSLVIRNDRGLFCCVLVEIKWAEWFLRMVKITQTYWHKEFDDKINRKTGETETLNFGIISCSGFCRFLAYGSPISMYGWELDYYVGTRRYEGLELVIHVASTSTFHSDTQQLLIYFEMGDQVLMKFAAVLHFSSFGPLLVHLNCHALHHGCLKGGLDLTYFPTAYPSKSREGKLGGYNQKGLHISYPSLDDKAYLMGAAMLEINVALHPY